MKQKSKQRKRKHTQATPKRRTIRGHREISVVKENNNPYTGKGTITSNKQTLITNHNDEKNI